MKNNKSNNNNIEYLPIKLDDEIKKMIIENSTYEYRTINNFIKCISTIYHHQVHEFSNLEYYVPLGSAYWKKVFKTHSYKSVIDPLIEMDIIQSKRFDNALQTIENGDCGTDDNQFKSSGSVEIRYRVNPVLTDIDEYTTIKYINNNQPKAVTSEYWNSEDDLDVDWESLVIDGSSLHVSIDKEKAILWVIDDVSNICNEKLILDITNVLPLKMKIEYKFQLSGGSYDTQYASIEKVKEIAGKWGRQVFLYDDTFYVAKLDEFIISRTKIIKHHYIREINKISILPLEDIRNERNLRLYNHLVNFPSRLLQFVRLNNRTIVQLDLRTSQFLLFANLLNEYVRSGGEGLTSLFSKPQTKKSLKRLIAIMDSHKHLLPSVPIDISDSDSCKHSSNDVHRFIRDVFYRDFYEVVKQELKLPNRLTAKQVLFTLLFSPKVKADAFMKQLSETYPTVMSIIAGFKTPDKQKPEALKKVKKQATDYNNFPVFLQCIESEIYIDKILLPLRKKNIPCSSRHDSIMVAKGFEDEVETFIRDVFLQLGFRYNQKVDDLFWEAYSEIELEEVDMLQWLIDENVLSVECSEEKSYLEEQENKFEKTDESIYEDEISLDDQYDYIITELEKVGIQWDYSESINVDFLYELASLIKDPLELGIIMDEIERINQGLESFNPETNEIIRMMKFKCDCLLAHFQ